MESCLVDDFIARVRIDPEPFLPDTLLLDYSPSLNRINFKNGSRCLKFDPRLADDDDDDDENRISSPYDLDDDDFLALMLRLKSVARRGAAAFSVSRCAVVVEELVPEARIFPLHGFGVEWRETWAKELEFKETFDGVTTSKEGPRMCDERLDEIKRKMAPTLMKPDVAGDKDVVEDDDNLFCKIVRDEIPNWRIWESTSHLAFLTPFPNTPGFTVVIPKKRRNSDVFSLDEDDFRALFLAVKEVVATVKRALKIPAVVLICEGTGVDYAHVKVAPVHPGVGESPDDLCRKRAEKRVARRETLETYEGYVSTVAGRHLSGDELRSTIERTKYFFDDL